METWVFSLNIYFKQRNSFFCFVVYQSPLPPPQPPFLSRLAFISRLSPGPETTGRAKLGNICCGNIAADANVSRFSRAKNMLRRQILRLGSKEMFLNEVKRWQWVPVGLASVTNAFPVNAGKRPSATHRLYQRSHTPYVLVS